MRKKGSDYERFALPVRYGERFDLPNHAGVTAWEMTSRKRDPRRRERGNSKCFLLRQTISRGALKTLIWALSGPQAGRASPASWPFVPRAVAYAAECKRATDTRSTSQTPEMDGHACAP